MGIIDKINAAACAARVEDCLRLLRNFREASEKTRRRAQRCAKRRLAELEAA